MRLWISAIRRMSAPHLTSWEVRNDAHGDSDRNSSVHRWVDALRKWVPHEGLYLTRASVRASTCTGPSNVFSLHNAIWVAGVHRLFHSTAALTVTQRLPLGARFPSCFTSTTSSDCLPDYFLIDYFFRMVPTRRSVYHFLGFAQMFSDYFRLLPQTTSMLPSGSAQ